MGSVLVFYRDSGWYGGVVNFIETLKKNIDKEVELHQFQIGRRKTKNLPLSRFAYPFADAFRLVSLLRDQKFDAYHINPSLNAQSLLRDGLFLLVLRIFRVPNVIVSFHGWGNDTARDIQGNLIFRKMFLFCFCYARQTLVLSETFRQWLIAVGFEASSVQLFTTMFDDIEFNNSGKFVSRNENSLLFLSRLVREKGMYELFDAFTVLARDYPRLELVFA